MYLEIVAIIGIFLFSYILILRSFRSSLYVLMVLSVLLHKELFSFFRWDLMPVRAFMLALVAAAGTKVLHLLLTKKLDRAQVLTQLKQPFLILILLLWILRGASIYFSKNTQASLLLFGFFTTVVILVFYLFNYLKDSPEKVLKYLKFYIFIVFLLTLFGYFQYYLHAKYGITIGALWSIPNNTPRVGATFWDVNHYGALIASLLPVLCVFVITERKWSKKIVFFVMSASLLVALLLTNSRTAWIIDFVAFLSFISILFFKKFGKKGMLYVFLGIVLVTVPLLVEYSDRASPFRARVKQYFHYRLDSFDSHFLLLTGTYQIFEQYPILGGGYGSFFEHFSKTKIASTYFGRDPAGLNTRVPAHTIWGELLSETGILGLTTFVALVTVIAFTLLYIALTSKELSQVLTVSAMVSAFIGWLVAGIFYSYNSEFFWLVIALYYLYGYALISRNINFQQILSYFVRSKAFNFVIILILALTLIGVGLGKSHLIPWDEAIYAKVAKNMVAQNDYLVLKWHPTQVWLEKPPLYMWLVSGLMHLFGPVSLAARLPSAVFGIATILLVYVFGTKLFNKTVGFIAALTLLTNIHFLYYSRTAMLDITAGFFITLSLYLYYLVKHNNKARHWIFTGICVGLALMTKGVVGVLPLIIIGFYEIHLYCCGGQKFKSKTFVGYFLMLLAATAVYLPWHILMYAKFGNQFVDTYIKYHILSRATEGIEDKGKPLFWYLEVIKVSMRIWFVVLLAAFPYTFYKAIKSKGEKLRLIIIAALIIFAVFSISKSKIVWYIVPLYPILGLIIGVFVDAVIRKIFYDFKKLDNIVVKTLLFSFITIFSLMYLFFNREKVFVGDLTGSQARLLQLKDATFGTKSTVYVDRVELPLVLFYTDSPFKIIDFLPTQENRVPNVAYNEQLILMTKKGRFSETVAEYDYASIVVKEDGDWILWYMDSRENRAKYLQTQSLNTN